MFRQSVTLVPAWFISCTRKYPKKQYIVYAVFAKYPLLIDHINSSDHHSDVSLFYTNKLQEHKPFSLLPPCIPSISCDHHWRKENRTWRVQSNDPDLEKEKSMKFNRTVIFNYLTISLLKEVMQYSLVIDLFHKWRLLHGNEARILFSQSILVSNYQTDMISFLAFFLLSIRVSF